MQSEWSRAQEFDLVICGFKSLLRSNSLSLVLIYRNTSATITDIELPVDQGSSPTNKEQVLAPTSRVEREGSLHV